MEDNATTQEVVETEGAPEVSDSAAEGTADVSTKDDSPSLEDTELDLTEVPEEQRELVKRYATEYGDRLFKKNYTRKTQELAAERTLRDQDYERVKEKAKQADMLERAIHDLTLHPEKADLYRTHFGIKAPEKNEMPQIETVEDLIKYQEQEKQKITQQMEQKMRQELTTHQRNLRWESAITKMREDPKWTKFEKYIVTEAKTNPRLQSMYNGANETQVLQEAKKAYFEQLKDEIESARKDAFESVKKKKDASTVLPQRTVTTSTGSQKKGLSEEEQRQNVIAAMERLGY